MAADQISWQRIVVYSISLVGRRFVNSAACLGNTWSPDGFFVRERYLVRDNVPAPQVLDGASLGAKVLFRFYGADEALNAY